MFKRLGINQEEFENEVVIDKNYQVFNPELGPLGQRVSKWVACLSGWPMDRPTDCLTDDCLAAGLTHCLR